MKKTSYINKYDFINYISRPDYLLFLNNSEIQSLYSTALEVFKKNREYSLNSDEDDESNLFDDAEFDVYEYFLEEKENNENIDKNNPMIQEGLIIDEKTKDFIKKNKKYSKFYFYDFDDNQNKIFDLIGNAKKTQELIQNNNQIILFQPTFIFNNKITRPDTFIKDFETITLIETKGTTTAKPHHYLDLLFQKKVIENQTFLKKFIFNYKLCLVSYEKLNKNEISFVTTPFFNYSKSISISNDSYEIKKNKKIGSWTDKEFVKDYSLSFVDAFENNFEAIICKMNDSNNFQTTKSVLNAIEQIKNINNNFDKIVKEIEGKLDLIKTWDLKEKIQEILPSIKDKNFFKKNDFFVQFKNIYYLKGFDLFKYSGNVAKQSYDDLKNLLDAKTEINSECHYLKQTKKMDYLKLFTNNEEIQVNENRTKLFLNSIKKTKIYFDFETINTAIRVVDNSLPFTQVVTQCSIIIIEDNKELLVKNLICDPTKINVEWYKEIIDNLTFFKDKLDDSSFIVYNQSFEKSRLKEMKEYLPNEYKQLIDEINKNIKDLAILFTLSAKTDYIFIKKLYGYYSIKKVLPIIEKENPKIFIDAKCVNYNSLEIQNGKICQQETSQRFFKILNEEQWKDLTPKLQKYCENDVRAMIAVEKFANYLISNK